MSSAASKKPNILFVFSDQQRRHSLGFMGQDPVHTPHLDRFAQQSLVLTDALSTTPFCTPARGSLITGCHPLTTGVTTNEMLLNKDEVGIGKQLQKAGYHTGYIGKWHLCNKGPFVPLEHRHGFEYWHVCNANHDVFWQHYFEDSPVPVIDQRGWQPDHEADTAIDFLRHKRDPNRPFALFVSTVPPHNGEVMGRSQTPLRKSLPTDRPMINDFDGSVLFIAPEEYEAPYTRDKEVRRLPNVAGDYCRVHCTGYFGGVDAMDASFGRILQCLEEQGLADNTIVVYTSDHGELMGSHDLMAKSRPFEESIGIPFIIRWPGQISPGRSDLLLTEVDMAPTLLNLVGASVPSRMEGKDLSGVLLGKVAQGPDAALLHYFTLPHELHLYGPTGMGWRGLRTHEYCFVHAIDSTVEFMGNERALYNLKKDPYQMNPILPGRGAATDRLMADMEARLKRWLRETNDAWCEKLAG